MLRDGYIWRENTYKALQDLSAEFENHARLSRFARYCDLKDKGLRKAALKEIDALVAELNAIFDLTEQYEIADTLMRATEGYADSHNILPHTLMEKFIVPVCEHWSLERPDDVQSLLWIGTEDSLKEAVERSPNHPDASPRLLSMLLSQAEFLTHHLPSGVPGAAGVAELVEQSEKLLGPWVNVYRASLAWECKAFRLLADSLTRYETSGTDMTFEKWARLLNLPACYDDAEAALERQGVTRPKFPD